MVLSLQRNGISFEKVKVSDKNYFLSDTSTDLLTRSNSFFLNIIRYPTLKKHFLLTLKLY
jgi:hypothetical protein